MKPGTRILVEGDIRVQTRVVLENIRSILEHAGSSMADVVKVNAHLRDMGDFGAYNEVYATFFEEPYPARTTVQSVLPGPFTIEIDVIAIRPQARG